MKKIIALLTSALITLGVNAAFLPSVGNGTEPNVWTRNISGVLQAAQETGYPIFLVMLNEHANGDGCTHCQRFVGMTINTSEFAQIVKDYSFYMVLLNFWGNDVGQVSDPSHGGVSYDTFMNYWWMYGSAGNQYGLFPGVVVLKPDGSRYAYRFYPSCEGQCSSWLRTQLSALCVSDTKFTLGDAKAVTVQEGGSWTGKVTRTGSSKKTGSVTIALSGAHADRYTVTPASIDWNGSDGDKTFTITGPSQKDAGLLQDTLTVRISASGFNGSKVSYGVQEKSLTFRDASVKQTLAEYKVAHVDFSSLTASGSDWYVPLSGGVLETKTAASSMLTWTAPAGGVLSLAGVSDNNPLTVKLSSDATAQLELGAAEKRVGVAAGDKVQIVATANDAALTFGLTKLAFEKFVVTLKTPADGTVIQWPELCADSALMDLAWSASLSDASYEVFGTKEGAAKVFSSTAFWTGSDEAVNAVEADFVTTNAVMGVAQWGVRATVKGFDLGIAVGTATGSFTISAGPEYPSNMPKAITAYAKGEVELNFAANDVSKSGMSYSAKGLPEGLKISSKTGKILGTPAKAGSYTVTVTAANAYGTASTTLTLTVAKIPAALKGNYNGVFFSGENPAASMTWKIAANGKWTGKVIKGAAKQTVKGMVCVRENGLIELTGSDVVLRQADATYWTGSWSGMTLHGRKTARLGTPWTGTWMCGLAADGGVPAGYFKAKIASSGKVTLTGKMNGKYKISGSAPVLVLPASYVSSKLPFWAGHGDLAIVQSYKKSSGKVFDGGMAFAAAGPVGAWKFEDTRCTVLGGSKWVKPSFEQLDGSVLAVSGAFTKEIPVKGVSATKVRLDADKAVGKLTATRTTGVFKGSLKNEQGTFKYEGALFVVNGVLRGLGGGSVSGQKPIAVEIVPAE